MNLGSTYTGSTNIAAAPSLLMTPIAVRENLIVVTTLVMSLVVLIKNIIPSGM